MSEFIEIGNDLINADQILFMKADDYNQIVVTFREKMRLEYEFETKTMRDEKFKIIRKQLKVA